MHDRETRGVSGIEIRDGDGRPPRLIGYAAVFSHPSLNLGDFTETILPGAFTRSLASGTDVMVFVEHDPAQIVGRRSNGSLKIAEDHHGLRVEITPIETTAGRDVIANVRAGLLTGMSFGFRTPKDGDRWDVSMRPPRQELVHVDLLETSIVAMPAYTATEVAVRSLQAWRRGRPAEGRARGPLTVAECLARLRGRERFWEIEMRQRANGRRLELDRPPTRTPPPVDVKARLAWMRRRMENLR
jgi:uncharacterized protein